MERKVRFLFFSWLTLHRFFAALGSRFIVLNLWRWRRSQTWCSMCLHHQTQSGVKITCPNLPALLVGRVFASKSKHDTWQVYFLPSLPPKNNSKACRGLTASQLDNVFLAIVGWFEVEDETGPQNVLFPRISMNFPVRSWGWHSWNILVFPGWARVPSGSTCFWVEPFKMTFCEPWQRESRFVSYPQKGLQDSTLVFLFFLS